MKKRILFFFVVLLLTSSPKIFAQLVEENFDYPVGDLITNHGWTSNGNPGVNSIFVVAPGLEFPCYAGSGIGNAVALNNNGPDASKFLSSSIDSGSVYVSLMVKITTARTGDYFFHLSDSSTGFDSDVGRIYAMDSAGKVAFGLSKRGNNNEIYTPAQYFLDSTYLVVIKYTFITGADNDLVSLFVFSTCPPLLEPLPTLGPIGVGLTDLPQVGKVVLRQGATSQAANLIIDGIYANTSWESGPLPVELSGFNANVNGRNVTLNWSTSSELNNSGFEIERVVSDGGDWSTIAFVNGNGTTTISHSYSFTDKNLSTGKFNYRLKQIDYNGNFEYFNLNSEVVIGTPSKYNLSQNYPNPFNPTTKISFNLASDGFVSVKIFDYLGKEVNSLVNEYKTAGYYSVDFNAANLSSGIYFYKLEGNGFTKVMKMTLVK